MLLPEPPVALGDYLPAVRAGEFVFTAGQLPLVGGSLLTTGTVGDEVSISVATECARACALNALAAASTVCDLDEVAAVVKLVGYVASDAGFNDQPAVLDGASAVLLTAFGDAGRHAREAVGVTSLPRRVPVEVSLVLSLDQVSGREQEPGGVGAK